MNGRNVSIIQYQQYLLKFIFIRRSTAEDHLGRFIEVKRSVTGDVYYLFILRDGESLDL